MNEEIRDLLDFLENALRDSFERQIEKLDDAVDDLIYDMRTLRKDLDDLKEKLDMLDHSMNELKMIVFDDKD